VGGVLWLLTHASETRTVAYGPTSPLLHAFGCWWHHTDARSVCTGCAVRCTVAAQFSVYRPDGGASARAASTRREEVTRTSAAAPAAEEAAALVPSPPRRKLNIDDMTAALDAVFAGHPGELAAARAGLGLRSPSAAAAALTITSSASAPASAVAAASSGRRPSANATTAEAPPATTMTTAVPAATPRSPQAAPRGDGESTGRSASTHGYGSGGRSPSQAGKAKRQSFRTGSMLLYSSSESESEESHMHNDQFTSPVRSIPSYPPSPARRPLSWAPHVPAGGAGGGMPAEGFLQSVGGGGGGSGSNGGVWRRPPSGGLFGSRPASSTTASDAGEFVCSSLSARLWLGPRLGLTRMHE
jgi:hypothetical protein